MLCQRVAAGEGEVLEWEESRDAKTKEYDAADDVTSARQE
jgi:hypothetical protein